MKFVIFVVSSLLLGSCHVNSLPFSSVQGPDEAEIIAKVQKVPKELEWNKEYNENELVEAFKSIIFDKSENHEETVEKARRFLAMNLKFGIANLYGTVAKRFTEMNDDLTYIGAAIKSVTPKIPNNMDDMKKVSQETTEVQNKIIELAEMAGSLRSGLIDVSVRLWRFIKGEINELPDHEFLQNNGPNATKEQMIFNFFKKSTFCGDMGMCRVLGHNPKFVNDFIKIENDIRSMKSKFSSEELETILGKIEVVKSKIHDNVEISYLEFMNRMKSCGKVVNDNNGGPIL